MSSSKLRSLRPTIGALACFGAAAAGGFYYRHSNPSAAHRTLDPDYFSPFTLESTRPVSATSAIFTFRQRVEDPHLRDLVRDLYRRALWSVQTKQPQLQIGRDYTPLPPRPEDDAAAARDPGSLALRLYVRAYSPGEMSSYIHRLPAGGALELRGPHNEVALDGVAEVVFLAGGTGIAPAMQVAHALAGRPGTRMAILWACRQREDCEGGQSSAAVGATGRSWRERMFGSREAPAAVPDGPKSAIVEELEGLQRRWNEGSESGEERLTIRYFVDEEHTFIDGQQVMALAKTDRPATGKRVVFVSGPDGFINYWAGPKVWRDGQEHQGPVGGLLASMKLRGWTVFKL